MSNCPMSNCPILCTSLEKVLPSSQGILDYYPIAYGNSWSLNFKLSIVFVYWLNETDLTTRFVLRTISL